MKPDHRKIALAVVALAVAAFVGGTAYRYLPEDNSPSDARPVFDPIWQSCNTGDSCVPVLAPCASWEPVNEKYKDEATAYYNHMIDVVDDSGDFYCSQMPKFGPAPPAVCRQGRCVLGR